MTFRGVALFCIVIACGGRVGPDIATTTDAAPSEAGPPVVVDYKIASQASGGAPAPVYLWHSRDGTTEELSTPHLGAYTYDGRFMAVTDGASISVRDAHGTVVWTRDTPIAALPTASAASPRSDGLRVLLMSFSNSGESSAIGTLDHDGTYHELVSGPYLDAPTYAPNGKSFVFGEYVIVGKDGHTQLVLMNDDGSGRTVLATDVGFGSFSFDGKRIAYVPPDVWQFAIMDLASHVVSMVGPVWPHDVGHPAFTPDDNGLVFVAWADAHYDYQTLGVLDLTSGETTTLIDPFGSSGGYLPGGSFSLGAELSE